jgi:hypothetical protein
MKPLTVSESQAKEYANRIDEDVRAARSSHSQRMDRCREAYRRWRNRVEPPAAGEEHKSNIQVPLIQWQTYGKWARLIMGLFGEDAEIIAKPTGPSDQRKVAKIARFMTWRVLHNARLLDPICVGLFRAVLFGRAHWYAPWVRDEYRVQGRRQVWYEGPDLIALWPDDLIVPAEDANSIHDFSFVVRKFRASPAALLRGEVAGRYFGIREHWQDIQAHAEGRDPRGSEGDEVKGEKDLGEGIIYDGSVHSTGTLEVWEWYGYGEPDSRGEQKELLLHYLPDLQMVIGAKDLAEVYPLSRYRRPFCEVALVKDGSYWPQGIADLLESVEDELSANENLFTEAAQFSIGPLLLYKPSSGFNPKKLKYEPFTAAPSEDPAGAKTFQPTLQPQGYVLKQQSTLAIAERVTGLSDYAMGRSIDRPNAPRTATGQVALIEQGNIRVALDMAFARQDLARMLSHFWTLECQFTPPQVFFRVTEEEAGGLFPVSRGGATMTAKEFAGRYDFDLKFADSVWSKEARKERAMALYQLDLTNPLIAQNPRALWAIAQRVHKALGDDNFADVLPEPPDLGLPKRPQEEWTLALEGEEITVHPADNDEQHLVDHYRRLKDALMAPPEDRDEQAIQRMVKHSIDHQQQKQAKVLMASLAERMASTMAEMQGGGQPGMEPGMMPAQDPQAMTMEALGGGGGEQIGA